MVRLIPDMVHPQPTQCTNSTRNRIGCYREVDGRALNDKVYPSADFNVTVELCAEFGASTKVVCRRNRG
jgi:hypothetical protein